MCVCVCAAAVLKNWLLRWQDLVEYFVVVLGLKKLATFILLLARLLKLIKKNKKVIKFDITQVKKKEDKPTLYLNR